MLGKIIGAVVGGRIDGRAGGGGLKGAIIGAAVPVLLRRLGPLGLVLGGAWLVKRQLDGGKTDRPAPAGQSPLPPE